MHPGIKKGLSILLIVVSVVIVISVAFGNQELGDAWAVVRKLDTGWLLGLLGCWFAYAFFDALGSWLCLRKQGYSLPITKVFSITLIGFFYSNITPGASGGQPMQVSSLHRAGVPVGNGTTAVTIRLIANQATISLMALVLLLMNREFVYRQLEGAIWFVRIGWVVNAVVVPLVLMAVYKRNWLEKLIRGILRLLVRIRLVRNEEDQWRRISGILDTYQTAFRTLMRSPREILLQCLCSFISLLALTGSIVFVYYAMGMRGTPWIHLLTLSVLLFISASYTPLPGASGAQEGGFLYYFRGIFTGGTIGLALLVWRFFTYYLFIFVGLFTMLLEKFTRRRSSPPGNPPPEKAEEASMPK